jgi:hypothetical protein
MSQLELGWRGKKIRRERESGVHLCEKERRSVNGKNRRKEGGGEDREEERSLCDPTGSIALLCE